MDAKNAVFYDHQTERLDVINEDLSIIQSKKGLTFGTDSYLLAAFSKAKAHYSKYFRAIPTKKQGSN